MLIIITGVSGSGKSEYAEQICCRLAGDNKKYYVATMQPFGEEGRIRIEKHKRQREGKGFETIEQYQNIGGALKGCKRDTKPVVLVECMSNLLANECFGEAGKPDDIFDGCMKLYSGCRHLVIVTNEVFSDGCEYDAGTTDYIRRLGEINVRLSRAADAVVEVVYSIPVFLKGDIGDVDN